jgi:hypothetical protein
MKIQVPVNIDVRGKRLNACSKDLGRPGAFFIQPIPGSPARPRKRVRFRPQLDEKPKAQGFARRHSVRQRDLKQRADAHFEKTGRLLF